MKKQKLINALLAANIKPEDWAEKYGFAAQDIDGYVYIFVDIPVFAGKHCWTPGNDNMESCKPIATTSRCKKWDKKVITRSEFVVRYFSQREGASWIPPLKPNTIPLLKRIDDLSSRISEAILLIEDVTNEEGIERTAAKQLWKILKGKDGE